MKSVKVYQLIDGKDEEVGTISCDGQSLVPEPNAGVVKFIATTEIAGPRGPISPSDPETFLAHLHRQYRSAYLRVGKPEEAKETPQDAALLSFAAEIREMTRG